MTARQIAFVLVIGLGLFALVLELIRRQMMREKYSLVWFFICVAFLSVPLLYDLYVGLGRQVGIRDPNSIFYFGAIVGLALLSLQFSLAVSTAWYQRKALVQHAALLEQRVRQLERRLADEGQEAKPKEPGEGA